MNNSTVNMESMTVYGIEFSWVPRELWQCDKLSSSIQFKLVSDFNESIETMKIKQMMTYKIDDKYMDVIVSNMSNPWKSNPYADDAFATLKQGQFWFILHFWEVSRGVFGCNTKGYESRGLLRLEIEESLTLGGNYLKVDCVCYAVKRFIDFQSRFNVMNPDYPMYQLLQGSFQVSRRFYEHCPPGCMDVYIPYTWTYE